MSLLLMKKKYFGVEASLVTHNHELLVDPLLNSFSSTFMFMAGSEND